MRGANKERGHVVPASRAVRAGLPILTNMYIMIQWAAEFWCCSDPSFSPLSWSFFFRIGIFTLLIYLTCMQLFVLQWLTDESLPLVSEYAMRLDFRYCVILELLRMWGPKRWDHYKCIGNWLWDFGGWGIMLWLEYEMSHHTQVNAHFPAASAIGGVSSCCGFQT